MSLCSLYEVVCRLLTMCWHLRKWGVTSWGYRAQRTQISIEPLCSCWRRVPTPCSQPHICYCFNTSKQLNHGQEHLCTFPLINVNKSTNLALKGTLSVMMGNNNINFQYPPSMYSVFPNFWCHFVLYIFFCICCSSLTWCVMINGSSLSPPLFISLGFFLDPSSQERSQTGTENTSLIQG